MFALNGVTNFAGLVRIAAAGVVARRGVANPAEVIGTLVEGRGAVKGVPAKG